MRKRTDAEALEAAVEFDGRFFRGDRVALSDRAVADLGRGRSRKVVNALQALTGSVKCVEDNGGIRVSWALDNDLDDHPDLDEHPLEEPPPAVMLGICLRLLKPASLTTTGHVMPSEFEELLDDVVAFSETVGLEGEVGTSRGGLDRAQARLNAAIGALREYLAPHIGLPWASPEPERRSVVDARRRAAAEEKAPARRRVR